MAVPLVRRAPGVVRPYPTRGFDNTATSSSSGGDPFPLTSKHPLQGVLTTRKTFSPGLGAGWVRVGCRSGAGCVRVGCELGAGLLLGGLLADLSAEHYTWVAQGDQKYPDATTILMRSDAFLARANSLF